MKLKTMLNEMEPTAYIKIGTQAGTNFFYAGTVEGIKSQMDSMTGRMRRKTRYNFEKAKLFLADADERWEKRNQNDPRIQGYHKAAHTKYKMAKEAWEQFKPPADREVLDYFIAEPIIDDVDGVTVAIIAGSEYGSLTKIDENGNGVVMK